MRKIGVTLEVTKRLYREFGVTDEQFSAIHQSDVLSDVIGDNEYHRFLKDTCEDELYCIDYAVTDNNGVTLIDWS